MGGAGTIGRRESTGTMLQLGLIREVVSEDEIYPWIDERWSPPWWEQPEWIPVAAR